MACKNILYLATYIVLLFLIQGIRNEGIYRKECQVWANVTRLVEQEPRLNVTCLKNSDCTGFDCNGIYFYENVMSTGQHLKRHTCFGVYLHPCHDPVDMTVYIEVKEYHAPYLKTMHQSTRETVDGFEEDIAIVHVTTELSAEFDTKTDSTGKTMAAISMTLQPVLHTLISTHKPHDAKVDLIPEIEVPIPKCKKGVPEIRHEPGYANCPDLSAANGRGFKHGEQETRVPGTENCTVDSLTPDCGPQQVCIAFKNGTICDCVAGYYYDENDKKCEKLDLPDGMVIIDDGVKPDNSQPSSDGKGKSGTSLWIILVSTIGAVVLVALVLGFVVWKYRHIRLRLTRGSGSRDDQNPVLDEAADDDAPLAL